MMNGRRLGRLLQLLSVLASEFFHSVRANATSLQAAARRWVSPDPEDGHAIASFAHSSVDCQFTLGVFVPATP
jgi:hypothetical protein